MPGVVPANAVTERVEVPVPVIVGELRVALSPVPKAVAVRDTVPVNPFSGVSPIVDVDAPPPALTVRLVGFDVSSKLGPITET